MAIFNHEITAILKKTADLMEILDYNPFKVRAYRSAIRTVDGLTQDLAAMVDSDDDLTALPGVGKDIAAAIDESWHESDVLVSSSEPDSIDIHLPGVKSGRKERQAMLSFTKPAYQPAGLVIGKLFLNARNVGMDAVSVLESDGSLKLRLSSVPA